MSSRRYFKFLTKRTCLTVDFLSALCLVFTLIASCAMAKGFALWLCNDTVSAPVAEEV
jgi:hypothetical protein